jgi:hypothetical protein
MAAKIRTGIINKEHGKTNTTGLRRQDAALLAYYFFLGGGHTQFKNTIFFLIDRLI